MADRKHEQSEHNEIQRAGTKGTPPLNVPAPKWGKLLCQLWKYRMRMKLLHTPVVVTEGEVVGVEDHI